MIKRFWKRLWCLHHWVPAFSSLWGYPSHWDVLHKPVREYECVLCGKRKVTRHPPVNYIGR